MTDFSSGIKRGFTDEAAHDDYFHISNYIDGLAQFILNCNTPLTISIQGSWGSGKTSMMNMVKSRIEDKVLTVWFNTWMFSQFEMGNSLPFSMISVLLKSIDNKTLTANKIIKAVGSMVKYGVAIAADRNIAGVVGDAILNIKGSGGGQEDFAEEIQTLKQKLQTAINESLAKQGKQRIVVFVDDLDRLEPRRAVELLEVLKLFLDCENCVFVLAIDYEVVLRGVADKYNFTDNELDKGRSFFDKIVQVPFKMPVANYDINNYVQLCFKEIGMELSNEEDLKLYVSLINSSVGSNPRNMKRLFNAFLLLTTINRSENHQLLFAVLCLQHFSEHIYNFIVRNSHTLRFETFNNVLLADYNALLDDFDEKELPFTEQELEKSSRFLKIFAQVLDDNSDGYISQEEFSSFINILNLSTMTSSSNDSSAAENEEDNEILRFFIKDRTFGQGGRFVKELFRTLVREQPELTLTKLQEMFPPDLLPSMACFVTEAELAASERLRRNYDAENLLQCADGRFALAHYYPRRLAQIIALRAQELNLDAGCETLSSAKAAQPQQAVFNYAGENYSGAFGRKQFLRALLRDYLTAHPDTTAAQLSEILRPDFDPQGQPVFVSPAQLDEAESHGGSSPVPRENYALSINSQIKLADCSIALRKNFTDELMAKICSAFQEHGLAASCSLNGKQPELPAE